MAVELAGRTLNSRDMGISQPGTEPVQASVISGFCVSVSS
jgi:hypothetical protein